jgi:hypothetical protein
MLDDQDLDRRSLLGHLPACRSTAATGCTRALTTSKQSGIVRRIDR